jgi:hypothetical protein
MSHFDGVERLTSIINKLAWLSAFGWPHDAMTSPASQTPYHFEVFTGDERGAGTDSEINLETIGDQP